MNDEPFSDQLNRERLEALPPSRVGRQPRLVAGWLCTVGSTLDVAMGFSFAGFGFIVPDSHDLVERVYGLPPDTVDIAVELAIAMSLLLFGSMMGFVALFAAWCGSGNSTPKGRAAGLLLASAVMALTLRLLLEGPLWPENQSIIRHALFQVPNALLSLAGMLMWREKDDREAVGARPGALGCFWVFSLGVVIAFGVFTTLLASLVHFEPNP